MEHLSAVGGAAGVGGVGGAGGPGGPGVVRGVSRKKEQVTSKKIHRLQLSLLPCLVFKTAKGSESACVKVSRARWKQAEVSEMYAVIENHLAEHPAFWLFHQAVLSAQRNSHMSRHLKNSFMPASDLNWGIPYRFTVFAT